MKAFMFDVKLFACIRVNATDETAARKLLADHLDGTDANLGVWMEGPELGQPILAEVSIDGEADLVEVDGEAT